MAKTGSCPCWLCVNSNHSYVWTAESLCFLVLSCHRVLFLHWALPHWLPLGCHHCPFAVEVSHPPTPCGTVDHPPSPDWQRPHTLHPPTYLPLCRHTFYWTPENKMFVTMTGIFSRGEKNISFQIWDKIQMIKYLLFQNMSFFQCVKWNY